MKHYALTTLLVLFMFLCFAQKRSYDVVLFGKKIGSTIVERIDKGNGVVDYKLTSSSEVDVLFSKKTSYMNYDVVYKDGKLISAYVKNVKDGVTEIVNIIWEGTQYMIKKGAEMLHLNQQLDFSTIHLYFTEPVNRTRIFSERLGQYCNFTKLAEGVYQCKLDNGVSNIYRYRNGILYEMEMSKGASVFLKLVQ